MVRNIVAEKLARSTFESEDSDEAPTSLPGPRTTIESNAIGAFRPREAVVESEEFHLVGFEPAYGYRRHGQDGREEEEEEEEDDFLAWARIIGQGEGRETTSPATTHSSNQHRRLGEALGREECEGEARAEASTGREHTALPRMREAHLIRTYRPNTRYSEWWSKVSTYPGTCRTTCAARGQAGGRPRRPASSWSRRSRARGSSSGPRGWSGGPRTSLTTRDFFDVFSDNIE